MRKEIFDYRYYEPVNRVFKEIKKMVIDLKDCRLSRYIRFTHERFA